jgi:hypothetical protein
VSYNTKISNGMFKKLAKFIALVSVSFGFNKNCAGNKGISRLSFKTIRILQRGFKPCLMTNFKFFKF